MPEPLYSHGKVLPRSLYPYNKLPYRSFLFGYRSQLSRFLLPARPPHADVIHLVHLWILFPFLPTRYLSVLLHLPQYQDVFLSVLNRIKVYIFLFAPYHMQSDNNDPVHFHLHLSESDLSSLFSAVSLRRHYSSNPNGLIPYYHKMIHNLPHHQMYRLLHPDPSILHSNTDYHLFYPPCLSVYG